MKKHDHYAYIISAPDGGVIPDDLGRSLAGAKSEAVYYGTKGHSGGGCTSQGALSGCQNPGLVFAVAVCCFVSGNIYLRRLGRETE